MARLDLSLTPEELESFLADHRTVRLATVDRGGRPQVVPLWFVWLDGAMFLNSTMGNLTVRNFEANPGVSAVVDDGASYDELRGAIVRGRMERADEDPRIPAVADAWSAKYMAGKPVPYGRWKNRAWFRLEPEEITSWDFRKIPAAKARAEAEGGRRS
jgi:nitroimidazol reductase NimA-like FMN-containing flavoprotein (pyridoxamine 5'-phosphate oxidase superfamily)